jgi:hypothetical protein
MGFSVASANRVESWRTRSRQRGSKFEWSLRLNVDQLREVLSSSTGKMVAA